MLNGKDNSEISSPLVRERSQVQSLPAAPENPMKSGISGDTENPLTTFRDATEHEHAPSSRAESVRDVREAFQRLLVNPGANARITNWTEHTHHIIGYLRMAERGPLTAGCRANLAGHVAAVSAGRL